jgi:hypothetical protein
MTKVLVPIPIAVLAVTGIGYGLCRAAGRLGHGREALVAALICIVAGEVAATPILLAQDSDVSRSSQAGLLGTLGHLFLTVVLAAVVWMLQLAGERQPFLFWLLALYWVSLVTLVAIVVRVIRQTSTPGKTS